MNRENIKRIIEIILKILALLASSVLMMGFTLA